MCIGIFLPEVLRGFLEFLDRLIPKVCQLLLERIALIRRCLLQINLRLLFLIDESIASIEVRFQPLHFALRLFRLLHLFLSRGALLGDDVLEVDVDLRVFTALYSALGLVRRLLVIRRREYNKYAVNARAQVRQAKFASAIRLGLLLCALIAYRSNDNVGPGLPIHIQDCAANRSCLGRSLWCKYARQRGHQDSDKRPRLMKTLHASFSFFTGETRPEYPGCVRPIISLMRADSKLSARQKRYRGRKWGPGRRLPRKRASAAGSYRKRRRQYLRSGSTTRLDAVARPVRCPAG